MICPGFIATAHGLREIEMLARQGVDVSEAAIASVALILASDKASFVNGAHLFTDNGYTAI